MMKEFSKWIDDSKVNQLDARAEEVITNLRRQVAKRRWKRAKSLISIGRMLQKRLSQSSLDCSESNRSEEEGLDESKLPPNKALMCHHMRRMVVSIELSGAGSFLSQQCRSLILMDI